MRTQFVSGTHAIATALFAVLRPGDELLAVAGKPYDTLEEVIGLRGTPGHGSLREWGVSYRELLLTADGSIDFDRLPEALTPSALPYPIPFSDKQGSSLMHVVLLGSDLVHALLANTHHSSTLHTQLPAGRLHLMLQSALQLRIESGFLSQSWPANIALLYL